jgi:DNA-binding response OmpR family regulator
MDRGILRSARILLAEDDFFILMELEATLQEAGAEIISCQNVEIALKLANESDVDAALLDIRLGRQTIAPVARCLARRNIPFAFYSAQSPGDPSLSEWPNSVILEKPASPKTIITALAALMPALDALDRAR